MLAVVDQLPRLGKRELICLLLFTCNHVVSVWRGFLFLLMLGMGYVILLWHSLSPPSNYFEVGSILVSACASLCVCVCVCVRACVRACVRVSILKLRLDSSSKIADRIFSCPHYLPLWSYDLFKGSVCTSVSRISRNALKL